MIVTGSEVRAAIKVDLEVSQGIDYSELPTYIKSLNVQTFE